MTVGTKVCHGKYWDRVSRAPGWYSKNTRPGTYLFLIRYVLCGNMELVSFDQNTGMVPHGHGSINCENPEQNIKHIPTVIMRRINLEKLVRSKLEHEHVIDNIDVCGFEGDSEEGDEEL